MCRWETFDVRPDLGLRGPPRGEGEGALCKARRDRPSLDSNKQQLRRLFAISRGRAQEQNQYRLKHTKASKRGVETSISVVGYPGNGDTTSTCKRAYLVVKASLLVSDGLSCEQAANKLRPHARQAASACSRPEGRRRATEDGLHPVDLGLELANLRHPVA